jgi:hypothetical protein
MNIPPFDLSFLIPLLPFIALDVALKAFSLWFAARKGQTYWFIAMILVNSLGILPAVYLFLHRDSLKKTSK